MHEAWEGITHGDAFNEHFLMSLATIGALCIGFLPGAETEFPEAVFVMLFFQVGELFEGYAEGRCLPRTVYAGSLLAWRDDGFRLGLFHLGCRSHCYQHVGWQSHQPHQLWCHRYGGWFSGGMDRQSADEETTQADG